LIQATLGDMKKENLDQFTCTWHFIRLKQSNIKYGIIVVIIMSLNDKHIKMTIIKIKKLVI